jgi:DNA-binding transcriptional regulator/RsmH inhibitor MraZ
MENANQEGGKPSPPIGMYLCKPDDRSRLKLPADWVKYFAELKEEKLFVTSLDRRIAQIYPMSVWRENEKLMDQYLDDPEASETVLFNAMDLGGTVEIDSQGRIVFPQKLRDALSMEGQSLQLYGSRGHIEVLTETEYNARKEVAAPSARESLTKLRRAGLK